MSLIRYLKSLQPGDRVMLKDNALPYVKTREWIFKEMERRSLLLMHEKEYYGLTVRLSQIDWKKYFKGKKTK